VHVECAQCCSEGLPDSAAAGERHNPEIVCLPALTIIAGGSTVIRRLLL